ncbi:TPA: hypothetical protein IEP06_002611 [Escherichia coli]|uniref:hypothetical protein n=1 Tax=Shigella flexneri TaxID=623 RepID=UPI0019882F34|nr:hypothetical protein [Shigella flexneri]EKX4076138.1 hypothetical protein [Escherichia coli]ULK38412.1 hypothetical protein HUZ91_08410 [Shigella flexneri]BEA53833.1 hypothetical protein VEE32_16770 [Escherichia coli]HAN2035802.1 hypothetical protein [Escherichia coli]
MDESRKKFEESWLRRGGESSDLIRYPENHHEIGSGDIGGQYVMDDVQGHWQTWQASRAAIEIECPGEREREAFSTDFEDGVTFGYNSAISECEGRIRAAGVKVKE